MFSLYTPSARLNAIGLTAVALITLGATAPAVQAQTSAHGIQEALEPGTVIPVTLNSAISSRTASAGDTFVTTVDNSNDAYNRILNGATVSGVVRHATRQSGNDPGSLELAFTGLRLADGHLYPLSGTVTSMSTQALTTGEGGLLKAKNTNKDQHLTYTGIGAGAGALAGILSGHKFKIEDVLLGGAAGYGVGSLVKGPTQIHDVDLKAGTPMGVLLGERVGNRYRRVPPETNSQGTASRSTYVRNGVKHYWYNNQQWVMNVASGQRSLVTANDPGYLPGR